jgi:hypothetical protein
MTQQVLFSISLQEFEENQKTWLREVLNEVHPHEQPQKPEKETYGTRKEVARELKISLPTLNDYTKKGIIKGYRIGDRVLYKWSEIEQAVQEIKTIKYGRR